MSVERNLRVVQGYNVTTVTGLCRAIKEHYARIAVKEEVLAPVIQFGRRHIEQAHAPPRIVLVMRRGPWTGPQQVGAGRVAQWSPTIEAHLWAPEPTVGDDEFENELLRFDAADPMLDRFLNVLARLAPGRIESSDVDPDDGQADPASVNHYGETYLVIFRFLRDVAREEIVWNRLPELTDTGRPTPQLSPPPYSTPPGTPASTIDITTTVELQEPS